MSETTDHPSVGTWIMDHGVRKVMLTEAELNTLTKSYYESGSFNSLSTALKERDGLIAVIKVDAAELAVRLCEANYELKRPSPDAKAALAAMDEDVRSAWLNTAKAAANYFAELLSKAKRVS